MFSGCNTPTRGESWEMRRGRGGGGRLCATKSFLLPMENRRVLSHAAGGPQPAEAGACSHGSSPSCLHQLGMIPSRYEQMQLPRSSLAWRLMLLLLICSSSRLFLAHADASELPEAVHGYGNGLTAMQLDSRLDLRQQRQTVDREVQLAAFQAFGRSKTGRVYNVSVSGTSSASIIQAMRVRSGSLRKRGLLLNEFLIPPGGEIENSPDRVLLVYAKFVLPPAFLSLPRGYQLVAAPVGLFAYDALDLTTPLPVPKLNLIATKNPISVQIPPLPSPRNSTPLCAFFDDNSNNVSLSNSVSPPTTCNTTHLGLFSLVVPSSGPAPVPSPSPSPTPGPVDIMIKPARSEGRSSKAWKIAVGSVVGGLALVAGLSILAFAAVRYKRNQRIALMEFEADQGETLQTALIRNSRAPTAGGTRTPPMLESEYVV